MRVSVIITKPLALGFTKPISIDHAHLRHRTMKSTLQACPMQPIFRRRLVLASEVQGQGLRQSKDRLAVWNRPLLIRYDSRWQQSIRFRSCPSLVYNETKEESGGSNWTVNRPLVTPELADIYEWPLIWIFIIIVLWLDSLAPISVGKCILYAD